MKKNKLYRRFFILTGFALLLAIVPFSLKAQNDTISDSFKTQFTQNLIELGELYCWHDSTFYPGKFKLNPIGNVEAKFKEIDLSFFSDYNDKTELYLRFLENLPVNQKQNFIRFFSFFEKDFEAALEHQGLPLDFKYLAPAFSAMNPGAETSDKSAGVWELTHFQAVLNGLQINKFVDERFDVLLSTAVAAKQIKQNFIQFKTYDLAILAYLFGNVKVRNAIRGAEENGGEAVDYLPAAYLEKKALVQAISILLNENRFIENIDPLAKIANPDTANVNRQLHLKQIADVLGISFQQLQNLNPQFKFSIVPGNEKSHKIILPAGEWDDFVLWQDSIYNTYDSSLFQLVTQKIEYPPSPNRKYAREPVKDLEIEGKTKVKYRIKTGDVLGIIAENYDVRVADLKYWNNIYNERRIQAGKFLDIFVDEDKADYYLSLANPKKKETSTNSFSDEFRKTSTLKVFEELSAAKRIEHTVKRGESPYVIAKQYKGVRPEQILEWNHIDDARKIQIGQKLIVYILNETR